MDKEICEKCAYYSYNYVTEEDICTYNWYNNTIGYFVRIKDIEKNDLINGCQGFRFRENKYGHIYKHIGDTMRNDDFNTTLRSYDHNKGSVLSKVEIVCENYDVFKQVVEAVMPILEKEDIKKECD